MAEPRTAGPRLAAQPCVAGPLRFLEAELAALDEKGLLRSAETRAGINLCSNDYLGFARQPLAATSEAPGAGASALVLGHTEPHRQAERALASWLDTEAALLFSSGYAANVGVISSLAGPGDLVLSDRLNHASIIDGCRLSRAHVAVFDHCDCASLEAALVELRPQFRRCIVVTESYFSMDGDAPALSEVRALTSAHDAVMVVDEAHAVGVYGRAGRGRCELEGVQPDVLVGTFGKSFGLHGAFVAGSGALRTFLWNRARSFVFSTALSPALAAAVSERLPLVIAADDRRARLFEVAGRLRRLLTARGARVLGQGPIIPWLVGDATAAVRAQAALAERGVLAVAIRPPTVPDGTSRLRLTAGSHLGEVELESVCNVIDIVAGELSGDRA